MSWAVFLDRDGAIIHDRHYLSEPAGVELLPGAVEGLRLLRELGAQLVVVTNQSGVGRGYFSALEVERVNARMRELLTQAGADVDAIYVCVHAPQDGCDCRKPAPGMLHRAARELQLDLARSFMIGDRDSDRGAARAAGVSYVHVGDRDSGEGLWAEDLRAAAVAIDQAIRANVASHARNPDA